MLAVGILAQAKAKLNVLLKKLVIPKDFRRLTAGEFSFSPSTSMPSEYAQLFGPLNISVLVGPNGSGKTTLLRLVHNIFHFLEREPEKIPCDFTLEYEVTHSADQVTPVRIQRRSGSDVCVSIGNLPPKQLSKHHPKKGHPQSTEEGQIAYPDLIPFLPASVVVSAFSLHGEYPQRSANFKGDRRVQLFDTSLVYGKNHYGLPSLSRGIARLAASFASNADATNALASTLGLQFLGKVLVKKRASGTEYLLRRADEEEEVAWRDYRWRGPESEPSRHWLDFTTALEEEERAGSIYFNDLLMQRGEQRLHLSNMSSGEKMLFIRLLSLLSGAQDNTLVLIEEPEIHLDPAWCKQLITLFQSMFGHFKMHFVISTHASSFINAVFPENLVRLRNGSVQDSAAESLLMANHATVAGNLFGEWQRPNFVERYIESIAKSEDAEQLDKWLRLMGESALRLRLFARMRELKADEKSKK